MFIRIKQIKKNGKCYKYGYLVENKWMKRGNKGAKQKVKGYLGKVVDIDKEKDHDFFTYYNIRDVKDYLKENTRNDIINDLIRLTLYNHGFTEEGDGMVHHTIVFDGKEIKDKDTGKHVVIPMNEGYMCSHTISRLVQYNKKKKDEQEKGYELAKYFVEAGLAIPQELFVGMFRLF